MKVLDEKCYVGIDVSKPLLDLYVLPCNKYMQFKNDKRGIKKLVSKMKSFAGVSIVMEATGGYEQPLSKALAKAELCVAIINPRRIRDFAKALGKLAKTDKIDSEVIALFAEKMQPQGNVVVNEKQKELANVNARRKQLIDMITMEKNRLDKVTNQELKRSINRIIKVLQKELDAISESLQKAINNAPDYRQKKELLESIKGIGPVTAAGVIANLPELGRLSGKQIGALVGLAPYNRDSGSLRGKRSIWGGREIVRSGLYMPTLVAIRHNAQIKAFYKRLCDAGKLKKVAIIACMRKLLIIMNAMMKNGETWRLTTAIEI